VLADGEPEDRWAGIVCILMFGACLGVFLRMIALKRRQA